MSEERLSGSYAHYLSEAGMPGMEFHAPEDTSKASVAADVDNMSANMMHVETLSPEGRSNLFKNKFGQITKQNIAHYFASVQFYLSKMSDSERQSIAPQVEDLFGDITRHCVPVLSSSGVGTLRHVFTWMKRVGQTLGEGEEASNFQEAHEVVTFIYIEKLVKELAKLAPDLPLQTIVSALEQTSMYAGYTQDEQIDRFVTFNQLVASDVDGGYEAFHTHFVALINNQEFGLETIQKITQIFTVSGTHELRDDVVVTNEAVVDPFSHELSVQVLADIVEILSGEKEKYRFPLGVFLTLLPVDKLTKKSLDVLDPIYIDSNMVVKLGHPNWHLCETTEYGFDCALREDRYCVVNDAFLVKFYVKMTALCLRTCYTNDQHIFLEGVFYSPVLDPVREEILELFKAGNSVITLRDGGGWAMMRSILFEENFARVRLQVEQNEGLRSSFLLGDWKPEVD